MICNSIINRFSCTQCSNTTSTTKVFTCPHQLSQGYQIPMSMPQLPTLINNFISIGPFSCSVAFDHFFFLVCFFILCMRYILYFFISLLLMLLSIVCYSSTHKEVNHIISSFLKVKYFFSYLLICSWNLGKSWQLRLNSDLINIGTQML